jgi:two-component system sensor histidine kinase/response regulator
LGQQFTFASSRYFTPLNQPMDTSPSPNLRATILVVDDSPDTLTLISGLLRDQYRVKIANRGEPALAIAATTPQPDLILLDIMMPEMDGYEVCTQLKAKASTQNIPVIFLTAKTDIEDEQYGFELGAVDYITKPVSPPILLARVQTHLNLKSAYDRLQRLLKFREDMVNMIVHDLRNPLSSILPIADTLLESPELPPERRQKMLQLIQTGGKQLQILVEDLLLKAKLESSTLSLKRQPTNLCELCELALKELEAMAARKHIHLRPEFAPPPHRLINVDALLFRRAIENLITNAIKFSPSQSEITVSVNYPETTGAVIAVADQGPGIESRLRERIFEKYEIGPTLEGVPQLGLGLAFCKIIVEAHASKISVADNPPQGSIFTIEIDH